LNVTDGQSRPEPTVTVVIPAYMNSKLTNEALESVRSQIYTDYEIILVDDCSDEETVRGYCLDGVQLIRREIRGGCGAARNSAFRVAKGRYIAMLDSDDIWLPDYLENQVRALEADPEVGLAYCHVTIVDQDLKPLDRQPALRILGDDAFQRMLGGNRIKTPSVVVLRREVLERCGMFDEAQVGAEDWEMWIRVTHAFKVHADPARRVLYRTHPNQLTKNRIRSREADVRVYLTALAWARTEAPEAVETIMTGLSHALHRLASQQARRIGLIKAARTLGRAIALCPTDLRCYLYVPGLIFYTLHPRYMKEKAERKKQVLLGLMASDELEHALDNLRR